MTSTTRRTLTTLALAFACSVPISGQQADDTEPRRTPERLTAAQIGEDLPFRLDAGEMHLADLVNRVAEQLGHNYLYEPALAQENNLITLQTAVVFDDPEQLEIFLGRMLWSKGFIRVPFAGDELTWEVLSLQGPRRSEIAGRAQRMSPDQVLAIREHHLPVQCALPLAHLNPQAAANALRPFFSSSASNAGQVLTMALGNEGPLLLHGIAPQVAAAIELVRDADAAATRQRSQLEEEVAALRGQVAQLTASLQELRRNSKD